MKKQLLVIIPTYNEKDNISNIIKKVFSLPVDFHILVVDDNSPDGTSNIVESLQETYKERLYLLKRNGKLGLGTAYITGFRWGLENGYQYFFEMDADFSHNPDDLVRLYEVLSNDGYDVVVGSRYVQGVNVVNWPIGRVLLSYFASKYVRFILGLPVHDATAGFVGYSRRVLESILLEKISFVGYAFQIEMKYVAHKLGFKIKEIPIIFTDRRYGQSKMSKKIIREAFWGVLKLRFTNVKKRYQSHV
ncbi:MAG: polyprenol monophosphomannose synthase [Bacteroidales bacterium]|nr:polyprenol monophosphomannose synthase [Bacteroidales bacterium]